MSSDDHPINIKGSKALRQDVGHREREGCPDHKQQRKRVRRQAGPAANTTTPTNAITTPADVVERASPRAAAKLTGREGRGELIGDGRHASRAEPKANVEEPEV